jgi:hypothetical protein
MVIVALYRRALLSVDFATRVRNIGFLAMCLIVDLSNGSKQQQPMRATQR